MYLLERETVSDNVIAADLPGGHKIDGKLHLSGRRVGGAVDGHLTVVDGSAVDDDIGRILRQARKQTDASTLGRQFRRRGLGFRTGSTHHHDVHAAPPPSAP